MGLVDAWRQFRSAETGNRFREQHERMRDRSTAVKLAVIAAGIVLIAIGIVLLFIPGPGLVAIALGLGLVASRSQRLAAALDRLEQRVRQRRIER